MTDIAKPRLAGSDATQPGLVDRLLRERLLKALAGLRHGVLCVRDAVGAIDVGSASEGPNALRVHVQVQDMRFYRALAFNGSVGAGEAYAEGWWRCDDPVGLVRLLVRNRDLLDGMEGGMAALLAQH